MMPVAYMRLIEDELEAGRQPECVVDAAARWNATARIRRFRTSDSFVFKVETGGTALAMRMHDSRHRHLDRVVATQSLAAHLSQNGVAVAPPVPSNSGHLVETLRTGNATYHVGCTQWLHGLRGDEIERTPHFYRMWGSLLSHLHRALQTFDPVLAGQLGHWLDHVEGRLTFLEDDAEALSTGAKVINRLRTLGRDRQNYGTCHCDAQLDNIIVVQGVPHMIDFDVAAGNWFAGDISIAAEDNFDPNDTDSLPTRSFLEGYGEPPECLQFAKTFQSIITLDGLATLAAAYDGADRKDDPPWLSEMRERHRRDQGELREQLLRS